jgi:glycosyltransferase involved in cell wall biosynthesis
MKVLIISPIEILLEPRLRKAAIFFSSCDFEVNILTCLRIPSRLNEYEELKKTYSNWNWYEVDLRKTNIKNKLRWAFSRSLHKIYFNIFKYTNIDLSGKNGLLNDAFYTKRPLNQKFDMVYTNLIDILPLASYYSSKNGTKLIYDSQEFFTGQYSAMDNTKFKWVSKTELKYIDKCAIVIATTNSMKEALIKKYPNIKNPVRCRNMPLLNEIPTNHNLEAANPLKIVWHGKSINIYSERGVHLIIQAILEINLRIDLYLQGSINEEEKEKLLKLINESNSQNKIFLLPPANADQIIHSIKNYDIGFIGEIPTELNQVLTSSNKLFDYISAGLAIVSPTIPGILETTNEFKNSMNYKEGSIIDLKNSLLELLSNNNLLLDLKSKSRKASKECFWENDFKKVIKLLN